MTVRIGTASIDGTPISQTDLARIEAEDALHVEQQRGAVRVVASSALDAEDCRTLLAMLGLGHEVVVDARAHLAPSAPAPAKRARKPRAA